MTWPGLGQDVSLVRVAGHCCRWTGGQWDQVVADIAAGTAFLEVAVDSVSQAQGFIQFSNGQETGV